MKLEKRSAFGWPATAAGYAPCKNGLVVHYDGSDQGLAGKPHSSCRAYWKATRRFHMGPARGWLDIGYSFGVCPHGIVMEGRGWQRQQAAQPGGNTTWTSCTFMSGDDEKPTAAQVAAFKELRAWLRGKGLGSAISYHGKFISTSCPGKILRGMVTSGALAGAPGGGTSATSEEDPLIGLKVGDEGEAVEALQVLIEYAGFGKELGPSGVDRKYGPATAEALRLVRKSVGSVAKKGYGDEVSGYAYAHLMVAVARKQGGK